MNSEMGKDTVGDVFRAKNGKLYKQIGYCDQPIVIIEDVDGEEGLQYHVIGSMNLDGYEFTNIDDLDNDQLRQALKSLALRPKVD
jgi:hypothetical protein